MYVPSKKIEIHRYIHVCLYNDTVVFQGGMKHNSNSGKFHFLSWYASFYVVVNYIMHLYYGILLMELAWQFENWNIKK